MLVEHDGRTHAVNLEIRSGHIEVCCPALFRRIRGQRSVQREVYRGFLLISYVFTPFRGPRKQNMFTCTVYGFDSTVCRAYFVGHHKDVKSARRLVDRLLKSSRADTSPIRTRPGRGTKTTDEARGASARVDITNKTDKTGTTDKTGKATGARAKSGRKPGRSA